MHLLIQRQQQQDRDQVIVVTPVGSAEQQQVRQDLRARQLAVLHQLAQQHRQQLQRVAQQHNSQLAQQQQQYTVQQQQLRHRQQLEVSQHRAYAGRVREEYFELLRKIQSAPLAVSLTVPTDIRPSSEQQQQPSVARLLMLRR
jgi:hypothetical protein